MTFNFSLLAQFYDPNSNGSFPGPSYHIPLRNYQVLPYVTFYTLLLVATLATEKGRKLYLKVSALGFASIFVTPFFYIIFK